jgi:hypothetical protein
MAEITWEDLKKYHLTTVTEKFSRSPSVQDQYDHYKTQLSKKNVTFEQVLLGAYPQLKTEMTILPNMFPYWTRPPITHLVAWVPQTWNQIPDLHLKLDNWLKKRLGDNYDAIVFEHSGIKALRHFNVFIQHPGYLEENLLMEQQISMKDRFQEIGEVKERK